MEPTLAGFETFVRSVMQVPTSALPDGAPVIQYSYDFALDWVNEALAAVPSKSTSWSIYARAVYNLAADTLINWAPDQTGRTYFADLRKSFECNSFTAGVIQSSSDEGTSESLMVPDAFKNLTIANLANLKTPYGRAYLGIAQSYGTLWGLS